MKPKVLLVGGPDVDLRIALIQRLRADFDVVALGTSHACADRFAAAGLRFQHYPMTRNASPLQDLRALHALYRWMRAERPALVHTLDTKPTVWGRLAARAARVPVVIGTIPGLGMLYSHDDRPAQWVRTLYEPLQGLACRLSDMTVFQNPEDLDLLVSRRVAVAHKSMLIHGSGISTDQFRPTSDATAALADRLATRRELGIGAEDVAVLLVTRLTRSKGVLDYAAAARLAGKKTARLQFLLVGPQDCGAADALTDGELAEVAASVRWLGERRDVPRLLAACDVFACPTYYGEGVPRALLEAAASGLALVASDVPGCRAVVVHGRSGMLVPPRQPGELALALVDLARDAPRRERLGAAARQVVEERFDLDVIAAATIGLYHRLLRLAASAHTP